MFTVFFEELFATGSPQAATPVALSPSRCIGSATGSTASPESIEAERERERECELTASLFEYADDKGTYWMPRAGLHQLPNGRELLQQLRAVGRVLCKCLLELRSIPQARHNGRNGASQGVAGRNRAWQGVTGHDRAWQGVAGRNRA